MGLFDELDALDSNTRESYVRAPFGWVGNKYKYLGEILPHLPYRNTFVEVFGGTGNVILNRKPSKLDVYNDRYGGIVAFYQCIRDWNKLEALAARLETTCYAREEFVWCKETWEDCTDDVERAARWYYAARASFASLGDGFGRVIKGKNSLIRKIEKRIPEFYKVHNRIQEILIENLDWETCIKDFDSKDTVFYIDPPYLGSENNKYKTHLTQTDHERLLDVIFACKGFVAVSGFSNELYESRNWTKSFTYETYVSMEHPDRPGRKTNMERLWIKE